MPKMQSIFEHARNAHPHIKVRCFRKAFLCINKALAVEINYLFLLGSLIKLVLIFKECMLFEI